MAYTMTPDLMTGNRIIDEEHKLLFEAINGLLDACNHGKGRAKIEETTKFLYDYTSKHFADEEKLQLKYQYPDYPNHKRYHESFKRIVAELMEQLRKEGPTIVLVGKVNTHVGDWLVHHIKREDVRLAAHIRSVSGSDS